MQRFAVEQNTGIWPVFASAGITGDAGRFKFIAAGVR
jgi:hypothetical protein